MILLNIAVVLLFGHLLMYKDYSIHPRWIYFMDGLVFASNFAIVLLHFTNVIGI